MRNYLEDWLSEEESVVVPPPAQSVSRQRRTKQGEEAEEGNSAGQTSGKQIENDGARMVWTEQREAGGGTAGEKSSGPLAAERAALPMGVGGTPDEAGSAGGAVCGDGEGRAGGTAGSGRRTGAVVPLALPGCRSGRRRWNIWTGRCSGMRGGMTVGFRCIKRFDLGKEGTAWR